MSPAGSNRKKKWGCEGRGLKTIIVRNEANMGRGTREHEPAAGRENTSREGGANNERGRNAK